VSGLGDTAQFRRKTALDLLVEVLGDYDRDLRLAAVEALGRLGDARAVTPLMSMLSDDDRWVREAASKALQTLGVAGQP
jgi:HEAT repeat protein